MAASVQVYKWTDGNGVVHYADQPKQGAKQIQLQPNTVFYTDGGPKLKDTKAKTNATTSTASAQQDVEKRKPYAVFIIKKPRNLQAIPNPVTVNVELAVSPSLQKGDKIRLYVDGKLYSQPGSGSDSKAITEFTTTTFSLDQAIMPRGDHTLQAQIVDDNGKVLRSTEVIKFTVNRVRVGS